ncbi:MAG: transposase, partial [Chloroflexia bacterium]|nr:transposase [Chloroflexia bacterium]
STFRRRHQAVARRCHAARRTRQHPAPHGALTVQILGPAVPELTDARWARVAPLLPPQKPPRGRPAHDHRTILAGMLWVARTGAAWRDLPEQFGPWETVHSRYQRWRTAGIWPQILAALNQDDAPATP